MALLEQNLKLKNYAEAYRQSIYLDSALRRVVMRERPDARVSLEEARQKAAAQPSFAAHLSYARWVIHNEEYAQAIEASGRALALQDAGEPLLAFHYDALHSVYSLRAMAYTKLGNYPAAQEALAKSLDNGALPFRQPFPDIQSLRFLAKLSSEAAARDLLVAHLEAAKEKFPANADLLGQWSAALRSGHNPEILPPLSRLAANAR